MSNERKILIALPPTIAPNDKAVVKQIIESIGSFWNHVENIWIVKTAMEPKQIYQMLQPVYDQKQIFIVEISTDFYGYLPVKAWTWLFESEAPS